MRCKNCGECCCSVAFTESERNLVKKTARELGLLWKKLELRRSKHITETFYLPYSIKNQENINSLKDYMSLVKSEGIPCPFLTKDKFSRKTACSCYETRPEICRKFGTLGKIHEHLLCENFEKAI